MSMEFGSIVLGKIVDLLNWIGSPIRFPPEPVLRFRRLLHLRKSAGSIGACEARPRPCTLLGLQGLFEMTCYGERSTLEGSRCCLWLLGNVLCEDLQGYLTEMFKEDPH